MTQSNKQNHWLKSTLTSVVTGALFAGALPAAQADQSTHSLDNKLRQKVNHIIVIYQENWSFDALYGRFPGVNGLANAFDTLPQLDKAAGYTNYICPRDSVIRPADASEVPSPD